MTGILAGDGDQVRMDDDDDDEWNFTPGINNLFCSEATKSLIKYNMRKANKVKLMKTFSSHRDDY